jgi:hypothetical protein
MAIEEIQVDHHIRFAGYRQPRQQSPTILPMNQGVDEMGTHSALDRELQHELMDLPILHQRKILDIVRLMKKGGGAMQKRHSILELKGCGKEIWKGVDAERYVNKLREEWG